MSKPIILLGAARSGTKFLRDVSGAIFGSLHRDDYLDSQDPEGPYVRDVLPVKLSIERAYIERAGFWSDIGMCFKTVAAIFALVRGKEVGLYPDLLSAARGSGL